MILKKLLLKNYVLRNKVVFFFTNALTRNAATLATKKAAWSLNLFKILACFDSK